MGTMVQEGRFSQISPSFPFPLPPSRKPLSVLTMTLTLALTTDLWLEISPAARDEAWRLSQHQSSPDSRWRAYLNRLVLDAVLPWLREEWSPAAAAWPGEASLPSLWEVVDGTAIAVGEKRLILLPTEAMDEEELRVPQEWLDIDTWAADYYLAIQVDPDDRWVRIWGGTTHRQLKLEGSYDPIDRTYSLEGDALIRDLSALSVAQQLCPEAETREAVAPLSTPSEAQADNLLQRLGDSEVTFPRLEVPFPLWGALVTDGGWRQRLYRQRLGQQPPIALGRWFDNIWEAGWQSLEELFPRSALPALASRSNGGGESPVRRGRSILLGAPGEGKSAVLLVGLAAAGEERVEIQVQLHPVPDNRFLPAGVGLALFSEDGQLLRSVQAQEEDNYIQIQRFRCPPGFRFRLQVDLDDVSVSEDFVI